MPFLIILVSIAFLALMFGPQVWVQQTMRRHGQDRPDFPGTGAELARHLLDEAGLQHVAVESTQEGDHYDPGDKTVRLSPSNYSGKSVTAVAVAAHEVGHAVQDRDGYAPLRIRQKLVVQANMVQRIGIVLLTAAPFVFAVLKSPALLLVEILAAIAIMATTVAVHAVTLPTEFDASFRRALPVMENYISRADMPAARQVLKAAAYTYVAAALVSLLDPRLWLRIFGR
ncbi:MAG: zinc metallopeptidase [Hyphomicrobiales bacterium]|nr:zinc metallopeptidase [Hyphomicrobiales bacterium]